MRTLTRGIETPISPDTSSRVLEELQAELVQEMRAKAISAQAPRRRAVAPDLWLGATLVTWLAVLGLTMFRPALVAAPTPHPFSPPPAERDASLRFGVWLARGAVERFVAANARLPSFLAETGFSDPAIELRATGERSYELVGIDGETTVTLTSGAPADAFLGASFSTLHVE